MKVTEDVIEVTGCILLFILIAGTFYVKSTSVQEVFAQAAAQEVQRGK